MITFDASGLLELSADLGDSGNRVGKEVADVVRKHGKALLDGTKSRSPVDTGELRGSWALSTSGDGRSGGMSAEVKSTVRQSFFQEHGTSKMAAQPSAGPALDVVAPGYVADMERVGGDFLD